MASLICGEMASRVPVIRADAIAPLSSLKMECMRLSIVARIWSMAVA